MLLFIGANCKRIKLALDGMLLYARVGACAFLLLVRNCLLLSLPLLLIGSILCLIIILWQ